MRRCSGSLGRWGGSLGRCGRLGRCGFSMRRCGGSFGRCGGSLERCSVLFWKSFSWKVFHQTAETDKGNISGSNTAGLLHKISRTNMWSSLRQKINKNIMLFNDIILITSSILYIRLKICISFKMISFCFQYTFLDQTSLEETNIPFMLMWLIDLLDDWLIGYKNLVKPEWPVLLDQRSSSCSGQSFSAAWRSCRWTGIAPRPGGRSPAWCWCSGRGWRWSWSWHRPACSPAAWSSGSGPSSPYHPFYNREKKTSYKKTC